MNELEELKRLLFSDEQRSLNELNHRVEDPAARSSDVASVLAESVRVSASRGRELSDALRAPVDECIRSSIREDVDVFADALFPVMGPAIRRSVLETFRTLVQSLNQTIESAFSWQGLKWRVESRRTGVPISELVLRDTLEYRVEQVFVIQHESGLLVRHAAHPDLVTRDRDAVSAMLTAIQDFVRDSFGNSDGRGDGLDVVEIGEHVVWLFPGPAATLAVVFRGTPRLDLRQYFAGLNEKLQRQHGAALEAFDGDSDSAAFASLDATLIECLGIESRTGQTVTSTPGQISPALKITLAVLSAAALALVGWQLYLGHQRDALAAALDAEAGIVVTAMQRVDGRLRVRGLRDPLAADVASTAAQFGFDTDDLDLRFEPYHSAHPALLERRAREVLGAPSSVNIAIDGSHMRLEGYADDDWLAGLDERLFTVLGFDRVDTSAVESNSARLRRLLAIPTAVGLETRDSIAVLSGRADLGWLQTLQAAANEIPGLKGIDTAAPTLDAASAERYWRQRLELPSTIKLSFDDGVLAIAGSAPQAWLGRLLGSLPSDDPYVSSFDTTHLNAQEARELDALLGKYAEQRFEFSDAARLAEADAAALPEYFAAVTRVLRLAEMLGRAAPEIRIVAYSDASGSPNFNTRLRERRAAALKATFGAALPPSVAICARAASPAENAAQRPARRSATVTLRQGHAP